jgi:hypothetical protein
MATLIAPSSLNTGTNVDLRQALTRRLATLTVEKRRLQARLVLLEELEKELRALLDGSEQQSLPNIEEPGQVRLSELADDGSQGPALKLFLQEQLNQGPKSLDQLVIAVRDGHFDFGGKSIARALHFHLLNLKNSGLIEKNDKGWKLVDRTVRLSDFLKRKDSE